MDALRRGRFHRARGSWQLKYDRDAYGQPLETELGEVYETLDEQQDATANLAGYFAVQEGEEIRQELEGAPALSPTS